jgi:hypothetical protein
LKKWWRSATILPQAVLNIRLTKAHRLPPISEVDGYNQDFWAERPMRRAADMRSASMFPSWPTRGPQEALDLLVGWQKVFKDEGKI